MKKLFLLLFSATILSMAVHAQDSAAAHGQHDRSGAIRQQRMDMMQELNLTGEQKAKMAQLRNEQKTKTDSIRNSSISEDEKMTQVRMLRENGRKAMEALLTPGQKEKLQQLRTEQMEKRKNQKAGADSTE